MSLSPSARAKMSALCVLQRTTGDLVNRKALGKSIGFQPNVTYFSSGEQQFFPLKRAVILKARSLRLKDPENA
jgi:hypothetical protein